MHVLITGGAGFIGSNLAEYHLLKGDKIHVVDDLSTGSKENISRFIGDNNFNFSEADILVWQGLEKAVEWADRIYHMAAVVGVYRVLEDPVKVMATNIAGSERLLRAARASAWMPRIIMASSSEVYGTGLTECPDCEFSEDDPLIIRSNLSLRWNYAITKLADEALGVSYARKHQVPVTMVRFFNTVGPRQTGKYGMVVPRFIRQAVNGDPITVYGDGSQARCFCDVRDTVVALDILAGNPESIGEIVNVGNNREISIKELAGLVKKLARSESPIIFVPYKEAYGTDFDEIYHRRPSLKKFLKLTDHKFKWTLEKTLEDLIERQRKIISRKEG